MTYVAPGDWKGRDDGPGAQHDRWHRVVRPVRPGLDLAANLAAHSAGSARVAIIGFASDEGVRRNMGRQGAVGGPAALRAALAPIAVHRPIDVVDVGDVRVDDGDLESGQAELGRIVAECLRADRLPIVLGGGHEVTWGSHTGLQLALDPARTVGLINLDAHFDLRADDWPTSGTGFAQIAAFHAQHSRALHYLAVGISRASNTRALWERAEQLGVRVITDDDCRIDRLSNVLRAVSAMVDVVDDVYLTIDLDVLPASVAPGVSAPAALGVDVAVVQSVVDHVVASGKVRVADIAELNPTFDIDGRTARTGARLVDRIATGRSSP